MNFQPRTHDASSYRSDAHSNSAKIIASPASSSLPHETISSASVSRSKTSQKGLVATADSLLRFRPPSNPLSAITTDVTSSISRSQASQNGLGAAVDSLLRSPIPLSSSMANPASMSRNNANHLCLEMDVNTILRSSVSQNAPSTSSRGAPASSVPPSYRSSQLPSFRSNQPPAYKLDDQSPYKTLLGAVTTASGDHDDTKFITAAKSKQRIRQVQQAVADASATAPTRDNKGLFKKLSSADLLFLIDTTSSMRRYIEAAKDQVRGIMTDIQRTYLGESVVRAAVIGYKDHCNNPNFTTSIDEARDFLGSLRAKGGEGWTADALGGLQQAVNATWMHLLTAAQCTI
jgi:Mg-chelatase subunit ChlD